MRQVPQVHSGGPGDLIRRLTANRSQHSFFMCHPDCGFLLARFMVSVYPLLLLILFELELAKGKRNL